MEITFSIPGEPRGKQRPRFTVRGGYAQAYTPTETKDYEAHVGRCYRTQTDAFKFKEGTPVKIEIRAFFKVPQKKQNDLPLKKSDADNIAKIILDGLNGLAYDDDKQVVDLVVFKRYAANNNPSVEVLITDQICDTL